MVTFLRNLLRVSVTQQTKAWKLNDLIKEAHTKICDLLGASNGELTFFNVLDEVQEALCMGLSIQRPSNPVPPVARDLSRMVDHPWAQGPGFPSYFQELSYWRDPPVKLCQHIGKLQCNEVHILANGYSVACWNIPVGDLSSLHSLSHLFSLYIPIILLLVHYIPFVIPRVYSITPVLILYLYISPPLLSYPQSLIPSPTEGKWFLYHFTCTTTYGLFLD
jgi:hypothetical protein